MSKAIARIWARLIHKGEKTIQDVPANDRAIVRQAYKDLFGEDLD